MTDNKIIFVSQNANADFNTISGAVSAVPDFSRRRYYINISPGVYFERVLIPKNKRNITFLGAGADKTTIEFNLSAGDKMQNGDIVGTFRCATLTVFASGIILKNLTVKNSFLRVDGQQNPQAVAAHFDSKNTVSSGCSFLGRQDTVYSAGGTQRFFDCTIEGDIDFIFGGGAAVFEKCDIVSAAGGYVAAPSTHINSGDGFLFKDCGFLGDCPPESVFLARPWHPGLDPDAVGKAVFENCRFGPHINKTLWAEGMNGFLSKNARFSVKK